MTSENGFGANILITGADYGIGNGLVRFLANEPDVKRVFAACLDPEKVEPFTSPKVTVLKLDVEDDETINAAYEKVQEILGDEGLNMLFNNAGIGGREGTAFENAERDKFQKVLNVNTIGPAIVTKTFLPLIKKADEHRQRALILNMGSKGGSIDFGYVIDVNIVYGMSKAALHFYTHIASKILKDTGIIVAALHPGQVKSVLNRFMSINDVDDAIPPILGVISKLKKEDSGKLLHCEKDGEVIPW